jgi:hypothetical protein
MPMPSVFVLNLGLNLGQPAPTNRRWNPHRHIHLTRRPDRKLFRQKQTCSRFYISTFGVQKRLATGREEVMPAARRRGIRWNATAMETVMSFSRVSGKQRSPACTPRHPRRRPLLSPWLGKSHAPPRRLSPSNFQPKHRRNAMVTSRTRTAVHDTVRMATRPRIDDQGGRNGVRCTTCNSPLGSASCRFSFTP